ncbi:MAG: retroviral-like aspartic protease family protein [Azospirillaceae bacterium]|nr:retroviral-like aspartic protease family protein [Azospirillaceae bacterium]
MDSGIGRLASALGTCALILLAAPAAAETKCQFVKVASLPVKMEGNRPLVDGSINGQPVQFLIDSGAFASMLFRSAAEKLGLPLGIVQGATAYGVGGESKIMSTTLETLTLDQATLHDLRLNVVGAPGNDGTPVKVAGLLGEDFLRHFDVEMDLSHGQMFFYQAHDCDGVDLLPWTGAYTVADFPTVGINNPHIRPKVLINGEPILAELDSGAYYSILTKDDAGRLGVTPESAGVTAAGHTTGIGAAREAVWIGRFDSFTIGDETIRHPKMRFGDIFKHDTITWSGSRLASQVIDTEMLLGADFLRAHHVLIAHSQGKLYLSYIGGPVFQTDTPRPEAPAATGAEPAGDAIPAGPPPDKDGGS